MSHEEPSAQPTAARVERKLTAILSADVAGYSRLMSADEVGTLRTLTAYRTVTDSLIHQHRGRIVGTAGDSILAEFASAVDAVQCAVEIQHELKTKNADLPPDHQMAFRIGINVGDVMIEGADLYGDGVNVAARLQSLADVGGIFISGTVYDQIETKLPLQYEYLGEQPVKNIAKPVRVYRVAREVPAPPVEQASSLHAARMAAPRRVGIAHLRGVVAGFVFIGGTIAGLHYLSVPSLLTRHSSHITPEVQPLSLPLPDKPSIVVLPFVNVNKDPDQDYFSDGLIQILTGDLFKISSLFVIARNPAFTYTRARR